MRSKILLSLTTILIGIWITISVLRVFYNFSKLFTEERQWYLISDEDKRAKTFGDLHYFLRFVEGNTGKNAKIVFLAPGGKAYYLGRYYLYPRYLVYATSYEQAFRLVKSKNFDYLIVYKTKDKSLDENRSYDWQDVDKKSAAVYFGKSKEKSEGIVYRF